MNSKIKTHVHFDEHMVPANDTAMSTFRDNNHEEENSVSSMPVSKSRPRCRCWRPSRIWERAGDTQRYIDSCRYAAFHRHAVRPDDFIVPILQSPNPFPGLTDIELAVRSSVPLRLLKLSMRRFLPGIPPGKINVSKFFAQKSYAVHEWYRNRTLTLGAHEVYGALQLPYINVLVANLWTAISPLSALGLIPLKSPRADECRGSFLRFAHLERDRSARSELREAAMLLDKLEGATLKQASKILGNIEGVRVAWKHSQKMLNSCPLKRFYEPKEMAAMRATNSLQTASLVTGENKVDSERKVKIGEKTFNLRCRIPWLENKNNSKPQSTPSIVAFSGLGKASIMVSRHEQIRFNHTSWAPNDYAIKTRVDGGQLLSFQDWELPDKLKLNYFCYSRYPIVSIVERVLSSIQSRKDLNENFKLTGVLRPAAKMLRYMLDESHKIRWVPPGQYLRDAIEEDWYRAVPIPKDIDPRSTVARLHKRGLTQLDFGWLSPEVQGYLADRLDRRDLGLPLDSEPESDDDDDSYFYGDELDDYEVNFR